MGFDFDRMDNHEEISENLALELYSLYQSGRISIDEYQRRANYYNVLHDPRGKDVGSDTIDPQIDMDDYSIQRNTYDQEGQTGSSVASTVIAAKDKCHKVLQSA